MLERPLAVISDIHGNRWALEAVLEDVERRGVERIVNLGDCLFGPLEPAATADLLLRLDLPTVQGNEDRLIVEPQQDAGSQTLQQVLSELQTQHLDWLHGLPKTMVLDGAISLFHGTPSCDHQYLLWQVEESGTMLRSSEEVSALVASDHRLILCGHDHLPRTLCPAPGILVVNPGSVGLPAYRDDEPFPHAMETGTPHARYAVISPRHGGLLVEDIAVPYDWSAAARCAARNGRPDWETWLAGRA